MGLLRRKKRSSGSTVISPGASSLAVTGVADHTSTHASAPAPEAPRPPDTMPGSAPRMQAAAAPATPSWETNVNVVDPRLHEASMSQHGDMLATHESDDYVVVQMSDGTYQRYNKKTGQTESAGTWGDSAGHGQRADQKPDDVADNNVGGAPPTSSADSSNSSSAAQGEQHGKPEQQPQNGGDNPETPPVDNSVPPVTNPTPAKDPYETAPTPPLQNTASKDPFETGSANGTSDTTPPTPNPLPGNSHPTTDEAGGLSMVSDPNNLMSQNNNPEYTNPFGGLLGGDNNGLV